MSNSMYNLAMKQIRFTKKGFEELKKKYEELIIPIFLRI